MITTAGKAAYERHKRAQLGADYPNAAAFEDLDPREQEAWNRHCGERDIPVEIERQSARTTSAFWCTAICSGCKCQVIMAGRFCGQCGRPIKWT